MEIIEAIRLLRSNGYIVFKRDRLNEKEKGNKWKSKPKKKYYRKDEHLSDGSLKRWISPNEFRVYRPFMLDKDGRPNKEWL